MGRKRVKEPMRLETFYSEIESWSREFCWGVNRMRWEFAPECVYERNLIAVEGRIWHIDSDIRKRRKFKNMRMHLLPSRHTVQEWGEEEVDQVGAIYVKEGVLCGSAFIPEQAHATLIGSLAAGCFKEMVVTVKNLRYNKGTTDKICMNPEVSVFEEDE